VFDERALAPPLRVGCAQTRRSDSALARPLLRGPRRQARHRDRPQGACPSHSRSSTTAGKCTRSVAPSRRALRAATLVIRAYNKSTPSTDSSSGPLASHPRAQPRLPMRTAWVGQSALGALAPSSWATSSRCRARRDLGARHHPTRLIDALRRMRRNHCLRKRIGWQSSHSATQTTLSICSLAKRVRG